MADLSITRQDVGVKASGATLQVVQVGEAVTQGQLAYVSTDGKYYLADADDTLAKAAVKGVFLSAADADGYAVLMMSGTLDIGATLTVGETYVVSGTAGGIAPIGDLASGDYVTHIGIATAADELTLNLQASGVQVP